MLCIYKKEAASDWFCRYEKTEILQKNKKIEKKHNINKIKKIKKMLAFCWNMLYSIFCWRVNEMRTMRSVGQAAKTSPSHGENRGSIPLSTIYFKRFVCLGKPFFVS